MNVFDAIKEMQTITVSGGSFSFSFMSYSLDKNKSNGPRTVQHAQLLPGHLSNRYQHADYLIRFRDMDTYEERHFWLPLMMTFNNNDIEL